MHGAVRARVFRRAVLPSRVASRAIKRNAGCVGTCRLTSPRRCRALRCYLGRSRCYYTHELMSLRPLCVCCGERHKKPSGGLRKVYATLVGPHEHLSDRDSHFYVFAASPSDSDVWLKSDQKLEFTGAPPKPPADGGRAHVGWVCSTLYQVHVHARRCQVLSPSANTSHRC